jgi:hypothetical protein
MRVKHAYVLFLGMLTAFGINAVGHSLRAYASEHPQQLVGNTGSTLTAREADALVAYHNQARKEVGVPSVGWSPTLANDAQEWADEVARTGKLIHRPPEGASRRLYGENMAWGTGLAFGVLTGAKFWHDEIKFYEPGTSIPEDIGSFKAAHYTQMVWKDTTEIGAGKAIIQKDEKKGWTVVVCNYSPPGNIRGQKPY